MVQNWNLELKIQQKMQLYQKLEDFEIVFFAPVWGTNCTEKIKKIEGHFFFSCNKSIAWTKLYFFLHFMDICVTQKCEGWSRGKGPSRLLDCGLFSRPHKLSRLFFFTSFVFRLWSFPYLNVALVLILKTIYLRLNIKEKNNVSFHCSIFFKMVQMYFFFFFFKSTVFVRASSSGQKIIIIIYTSRALVFFSCVGGKGVMPSLPPRSKTIWPQACPVHQSPPQAVFFFKKKDCRPPRSKKILRLIYTEGKFSHKLTVKIFSV